MTQTNHHPFNALTTELLTGINLLEASAGTGKTYTIAALVLRFILEKNIDIKSLLVVTFTKSATEELKDRIRKRLVEAKETLENPNDSELSLWLQQLTEDKTEIKKRLNLALLDIDQAGIFTIHSFCQRVLREHALESGQLFDVELIDDLNAIKQSCVDDFWRKQIYQRSLWQVGVLTSQYKTPDELLNSLMDLPSHVFNLSSRLKLIPEYVDLDKALNQLKHSAEQASLVIEQTAQKIQSCFSENTFKDNYCSEFAKQYVLLSNWLLHDSPVFPPLKAFELFSNEGLFNALNGQKFRSTKTQSGEERKKAYLQNLAINTQPFDELAQQANHIGVLFRRALIEYLRLELNKQLSQQNVLSFDDLISQLAKALTGENGALLIKELRLRFKAALIDEFQDTDEYQWAIFYKIFHQKKQQTHYLYLIGDPKQAIYKFRGADIYSYFTAENEAEHRFTLSYNYRSHPHLVYAVNYLFQRPRAFLLEQLHFSSVEPAKTENDGTIYLQNKKLAPFVLWQLDNKEGKDYWSTLEINQASAQIRCAVVNEIVNLLTANYSLQPQNRALYPQDIAILVRSNKQAREYQDALRLAKIPAVINSTESVFNSEEAKQLHTLLIALANPNNIELLKQALTLDWFGYNGNELYQLLQDEIRLYAYMSRFADYALLWQKSGLMATMQKVLNEEKIRLIIAKSVCAERQLTNLQHLIELLQQIASEEHLGILKTVDYLHQAIMAKNGIFK
jgi:exodeoxyribonuclease V beta subunit